MISWNTCEAFFFRNFSVFIAKRHKIGSKKSKRLNEEVLGYVCAFSVFKRVKSVRSIEEVYDAVMGPLRTGGPARLTESPLKRSAIADKDVGKDLGKQMGTNMHQFFLSRVVRGVIVLTSTKMGSILIFALLHPLCILLKRTFF